MSTSTTTTPITTSNVPQTFVKIKDTTGEVQERKEKKLPIIAECSLKTNEDKDKLILQANGKATQEYEFDFVFDSRSTQEFIFKTILATKIAASFFTQAHHLVFNSGPTNAGKVKRVIHLIKKGLG